MYMKKQDVTSLVGKSFEELSVDEMTTLQGAGDDMQPYSASVIFSVVSTVASAGLSGQISKAISTLVTAYKKCA